MKNVEMKLFHSDGKALARKVRRSRHHLPKSGLLLWKFLQTKPGENQFRRLHHLPNCIAGFFCVKLKLIVQVDIFPDKKEKSVTPDGITIIRFTNEEILNQFDKVRCRLEAYLWMDKLKKNYSFLFPSGSHSGQYLTIREN